MELKELHLEQFRNYRQLHFFPQPGVNLILGDNAQGKTNLLEAMVYLSTGKSFRTQKTGEVVRFGSTFSNLEAKVRSQDREQSLRMVLFADRRPRQLFRNGVKKKSAAECAGVLSTVLFCPEDLMVLKSGASARRKLGDQILCQLRPNYDAALTEYQRLLQQKMRILKECRTNPAWLGILPDYNIRICQVGALLISYRARFYKSLGETASVYHGQFTGGQEAFQLTYKTVSTVADPFASIPILTEQLQNHLQRHYQAELDSLQCLTGPHRDDFDVSISGHSLRQFGSQGQTRTAAISLKLAQRELLRRDLGEDPVLLLDDVLSELDPGRQDFVLNQISSGQVFITCCEPGRFTKLGQTICIRDGALV